MFLRLRGGIVISPGLEHIQPAAKLCAANTLASLTSQQCVYYCKQKVPIHLLNELRVIYKVN